MKSLVIFDIDGTLANLDHRLHYISAGRKDWDTFYDQAEHDSPIPQIIKLAQSLYESGHKIILVSGRRERIREITEDWLTNHEVFFEELFLRPDEDFRKDYIIKREVLAEIREKYHDHEILFVVDDRQSVVDMWRSEGLICLQCAVWDEIA